MRKQRYDISTADQDWFRQIGWASVDDVLAWTGGDVAAVSRSSDVVQVPVDPALGGPATVFLKRYRYDRFEQRVKQSFRGTLFGRSRARREYEFLTEMRRRQIPTVRPIAYGDRYGRAFLRASFLVTEGAEGFQSLDLFALDALRREPLRRSQRWELTEGLARTIRKMHDAGICHGGLFWRNILVRVRPAGGYDFLSFDPDTHGRLNASRVGDAGVVADLSQVVASGIALGQRSGLATLMKAYFGASRLTGEQRNLTSRILERGGVLAASERSRMAITDALGWLKRRVADVDRGALSIDTYRTVDDFFDSMSTSSAATIPASLVGKVICFSFVGRSGDEQAVVRTLIAEADRVTVCKEGPSTQDILIRTNSETWLALVSGHADAFAWLRAGRLRIEGDPTALCALMEHLDRRESTTSATGSDSEVNGASGVNHVRARS